MWVEVVPWRVFRARAPVFVASGIARLIARAAAQPACQRRLDRQSRRQIFRPALEIDENALRNLSSRSRRIRLAQRRRINEVRISPNDFAKGSLRAAISGFLQQFGISL